MDNAFNSLAFDPFAVDQGEHSEISPFPSTYQLQPTLLTANPFDGAFATASHFAQTSHTFSSFGMLDRPVDSSNAFLGGSVDFGPVPVEGDVQR